MLAQCRSIRAVPGIWNATLSMSMQQADSARLHGHAEEAGEAQRAQHAHTQLQGASTGHPPEYWLHCQEEEELGCIPVVLVVLKELDVFLGHGSLHIHATLSQWQRKGSQ